MRIGVFAVRAISAVLLFLTQIAFARWMGASEYGLYVTAWTCVVVLGGLAHLGFNIAMMRLAPQYAANRNYAAFRGLLKGGRQVALITSVLMAGRRRRRSSRRFPFRRQRCLATPLMLGLFCLPAYALDGCAGRFRTRPGLDARCHRPRLRHPPRSPCCSSSASSIGVGMAANAVTAMTIAACRDARLPRCCRRC